MPGHINFVIITASYSNAIVLLDALGEVEMPSNGPADFYVGLDDVTLTYCLPCNFDDLSEPGMFLF